MLKLKNVFLVLVLFPLFLCLCCSDDPTSSQDKSDEYIAEVKDVVQMSEKELLEILTSVKKIKINFTIKIKNI